MDSQRLVKRISNDEDDNPMEFERSYNTSISVLIKISLNNSHSDPRITGAKVGFIHNFTYELFIYHPVKNWTSNKLLAYWEISKGDFCFELKRDNKLAFPTDAFMTCHWDDGSEDLTGPLIAFSSSSSCVYHTYTIPGTLSPSCKIFNKVSQITLRIDELRLYAPLTDLKVFIYYISENGNFEYIAGKGPNANIVPKGSEMVLKFSLSQGTVETIELRNNLNITLDRWDLYGVNIIDFEARPNMTQEPGKHLFKVVGKNFVIEISVNLNLIVMDKASGLQITNQGITTAPNETKIFQIEFQTVGSNTCLEINYGDGYTETYGDATFCMEFASFSAFHRGSNISKNFNVQHVYYLPGSFNVYARASNPVMSEEITSEYKNAIVYDMDWSSLNVTLSFTSKDPRNPLTFYRKEPIRLATALSINHNKVKNTINHWAISFVNLTSDKNSVSVVETLDVKRLTPDSFDKLELSLLPYSLPRTGLYRISVVVRLWDNQNPNDPYRTHFFKFEKSAHTFIRIIPSDLVPGLVEGGAKFISRGTEQEIDLRPYLYTYDPDYPEEKVKSMTFNWFCRRMFNKTHGEDYPMTEPNKNGTRHLSRENPIKIPRSRVNKNFDGGGCFNDGPGMLDEHDSALIISASVFAEQGELYEIFLEIAKETRHATTNIIIEITKGKPPIMILKCIDEEISCPKDKKGFSYVNSRARLALKSVCSSEELSDCSSPLRYVWNVSSNSEMFAENEALFPNNFSSSDLTISENFFKLNPDLEYINIALDTYNKKDARGSCYANFKLNRPPVNGSCYIRPLIGVALIDKFFIYCSNWKDPEEQRITKYVFKSVDKDGKVSVLKLIQGFDGSENFLTLSPGKIRVTVDIHDLWGGVATYDLPEMVSVTFPTTQQLEDLKEAQVKDSGLTIKNKADILNKSPDIFRDFNRQNLSDEDIRYKLDVITGLTKIDLLDELKNITATQFADIATLDALSSAIASSLGNSPSNDVGLTASEAALINIENVVSNLPNIKIPSAKDLLPSLKSLLSGLGIILEAIMRPNKKIENSTDECQFVTPIDTEKAETDPTFQYDTDIGDDIDMEVPQDEKALKCKGILDSFDVVGEDIGRRLRKVINVLSSSVLQKIVLNEKITVDTQNIYLLVMKSTFDELNNRIFLKKHTSFKFAEFCTKERINGSCDVQVGLTATLFYENPFRYYKSSHLISEDALVLDLILRDPITYKPLKLEHIDETLSSGHTVGGIDLKLSRKTAFFDGGTYFFDAVEKAKKQRIPQVNHELVLTKTNSSFFIEFSVIKNEAILETPHFVILMSYKQIPTHNSFEFGVMVETLEKNANVYEWFITNELIRNRDGRWFLTVAQLIEPLTVEDLKKGTFDRSFIIPIQFNYRMRTYTLGCYFFNEKDSTWINDMEVWSGNQKSALCKAYHLTIFGEGHFLMPNTIDFEYIFANASFDDNLTIYVTIFICILSYLIFLIWASIRDIKDRKKVFSRCCSDNKIGDKYMYEIVTITGIWHQSSCESRVFIFISGDIGDTGIRILRDSEVKSTLSKGRMDSFIMTVPGPLGSLNFIRIWLDYEGSGQYKSWNLSSIVIRDVQTNERFEFVVNGWLSLEKEDGEIEKRISQTSEEHKLQLKHLFFHACEKNFKNSHLWFSIFMFQPLISKFSRCQRVSTVFAFMFLSMLANAMWYETDKSAFKGADKLFSYGFFGITAREVLVGTLSSLLAWLPIVIITFLFRKSKPQTLSETRFKPAIMRCESDGTIFKYKPKPLRSRLFLPWECSVVGWLLCLFSICISTFYVFSYGITFGNDKTYSWLSAFLIGFFMDVLVLEPIGIIIGVFVIYKISRKLELDDCDIRELEKLPRIAGEETWRMPERSCADFNPYDNDILKDFRSYRVSEKKIKERIRELVLYFVFLAVIFIVSYGNRDPNSYLLKWNLERRFIYDHGFTKVSNTMEWWKWAHEAILPELRASAYYNGKPPFGLRGFLNDQSNRIMGYATLRQVRVKPHSCRVSPIVVNITRNCAPATNLILEENKDYCDNWEERNDHTSDLPSCQRPEFRYTNANSLNSLPYNAIIDGYSGGGYVIHLKGPTSMIKSTLSLLQDYNWVNNHTRAIFLEFSVYNVNSNLFGIVTIISEFFPGGGIRPFWRIDPVRLFIHYGAEGLLVLLCEGVFFSSIVYFTMKELVLLKKLRIKYFEGYWFYGEWLLLISSYCSFGLYIYRWILSRRILKKFSETHGNGYVKLQEVGLADEYFVYTIGIVAFVSIIKIIKILQFNKKFNVITMTLRKCWEDLRGFFVVFFLAFFSFVQLFYIILHSQVMDFHTPINAFETCFTMLLNKFKSGSLKQISLTAALMFFMFSFCCTWVLVNVLITIIIEGFEEVKSEIGAMKNDLEILEFLSYRAAILAGKRSIKEFRILKENPIPDSREVERRLIDSRDRVEELPDKIDEFISYIDKMYLDGEMNSRHSKERYTRRDLVVEEGKEVLPPPKIYIG